MLKKIITFIIFACLLTMTACQSSNVEENGKQDMEETGHSTNTVTKQEKLGLPTQELQKGDQNAKVKDLQEILRKLGYKIDATGVYDADTTWALTDFQLQHEELLITGIYDAPTRKILQEAFEKVQDGKKATSFTPGEGLAYSDKVIKNEHSIVINNPYEILALVNKEHALPKDFVPDDLVTPDVRFPFTEDLPKKLMRKPAAEALAAMFAAGDEEGINLYAQSGYRSYETQVSLFASYVERDGIEAANKYSARPGESEHQSGLTMDVTSPDVSFLLNEDFGETPEGKWLAEHCGDFGFIIRYPNGKESITQYQYEPWHIRYVGKKAAQTIMSQQITLEEYVESLSE